VLSKILTEFCVMLKREVTIRKSLFQKWSWSIRALHLYIACRR
jgi:hypothetical protein